MEDHYNRIGNPDDSRPDINNEKSQIQEFYAGQSVFLTGCTGYLGKCVVEKLLRGCPDLKKLYLLVRPKKVSAEERIKKYFDDILFQKMIEICPKYQSKIVIIEGNLEMKNLGLSEENKRIITNNATIFFHNASNVKFEPKLKESFGCNIFGTKYMLELAKECKKLKIFVYISTAYSHCYQKQIYEINYPAPTDMKIIQDYINVDEKTPGGMTDSAKQAMIAPWPNIYTYGKATAENLVAQAAKDASFRCCIFRPSVVISTYQEPLAGWVDNLNGPVLPFIGVCMGIVHMCYQGDTPFDFIPADMCTNGMLATTWDAVINREKTQNVLVYNYGSSTINSLSIAKLEELSLPRVREFPSAKAVSPYFVWFPKSIFSFILGHILFHLIPGIFADIALLLTGRKPMALSILYKVTIWLPVIFFFSNGNWRIQVNETKKCWDRMNRQDNELFYNDLRTLDWNIYAHTYWPGLRVYALKDPMTTVEQGKKRVRIFSAISHILIAIIGLLFFYYFKEYLILPFKTLHDITIFISS